MEKITRLAVTHYLLDEEPRQDDRLHVLVYNAETCFGHEEALTPAQWLLRKTILTLADDTRPNARELTPATIADLPGEYLDPMRQAHFMCGCGHYVTCGQELGLRFDYCPNCWFLGQLKGTIPILRPDRLTPETMAKLPPMEAT